MGRLAVSPSFLDVVGARVLAISSLPLKFLVLLNSVITGDLVEPQEIIFQ